MNSTGPGFAVLYRWRIHPGSEESFVKAWSVNSALYLAKHGSLGSRLHRGDDGLWYSYAQWPSAHAREQAFVHGSVDEEASRSRCRELAGGCAGVRFRLHGSSYAAWDLSPLDS